MRKIIRGLFCFLVAGIVTICFPLLTMAELSDDAAATKTPNTHELHAPVAVASDEDVVTELSLNELYKNALVKKELDFAKFAEELGMEIDKSGSTAICRREKAMFYLFLEKDGVAVYFENAYGNTIELQTLSLGKDVARVMYYVATRATVDLHELQKKKGGSELSYLPLSMMYRVTVYEQGLYDENGEPDFESLEKAQHMVDFYNLH